MTHPGIYLRNGTNIILFFSLLQACLDIWYISRVIFISSQLQILPLHWRCLMGLRNSLSKLIICLFCFNTNHCCREGQKNGIWAWDAAAKEMVLVIPVVLAMLGDNPMQSELACHVGLAGKFFCRCCWVKGRDTEDSDGPENRRGDSDAESNKSAQSGDSDKSASKGSHKETMQELVDRAKRFLGVSHWLYNSCRTCTLHFYSSINQEVKTSH
jgi:hypothetical protein